MKFIRYINKAVISLVLCWSALPAKAQSNSSSTQDFNIVQEISQRVQNSEGIKHWLRIHTGNLRKALLSTQRTINLNLPDYRDLNIRLNKVQNLSASNIVASGYVENEPESSVTLVLNGKAFIANIRRGPQYDSLEVRFHQDGTHTVEVKNEVEDYDCLATPDIAYDEDETLEDSYAYDSSQIGTYGVTSTASNYRGAILDILVAYTPQARSKAGGTDAIRALIQMGITDTNKALRDSGANLSVRLVGTLAVKQNDRGNFSRDLDLLKGKGDGLWDEVHRERQRLGADQVTLVGSYANERTVGGIGFIKATKNSAFTIVKYSNFGNYTFSHELGHNLGLNHNDGYVGSTFRTIIAYGSKPRILRYSNPSRTYNGLPTGDSRRNEVKIINQHAPRLASSY